MASHVIYHNQSEPLHLHESAITKTNHQPEKQDNLSEYMLFGGNRSMEIFYEKKMNNDGDLLSVKPLQNQIVHSAGNFTCLMVEFKFRRRLGYFMFHTYIPTCLIVMMSWISFWIKPEAVPARVTLGVTSLLTLSTQHANSQKSLPPVSYIKVRKLLKKQFT